MSGVAHVWLIIPRGHVHVGFGENKYTGHLSAIVQHKKKYPTTVNTKLGANSSNTQTYGHRHL